MNNKDRVMALYQAFGTRDPQDIALHLSDDVIWVAPPGNATQVALGLGSAADAGRPDGSNNLNKAEIVRFMSKDFGRFFASDLRNDFKGIYADGDHVIVEHRLSATLANGNAYSNDYCFVFDFRAEKIIQIREYMDTRGGWVQTFGENEPKIIV